MRRCIFGLLSMALGSAAPLGASDEAPGMPLRKAGLWELRTETDEGAGPRTQALTMCVGDEMERETVRISNSENRANCPKYEINKASGRTTIDASCDYGDRKVTTRTVLEGDFTTTFRAKVVSSTDGNAPKAQGGHPVNVKRTILQEGKYVSESCGELKAGEARTADGRTVTVMQ